MLNDPPAHSMALPAGYDVPGQPLNWGGQGGRIASIFFANLVLSILTLGIYRFWGIVRMRRYVWTHLAPLGDRLEYAGTGGELLRGFLVVMIMLVPLWLLGIGGEFLSVLHPWLTVAVPATPSADIVRTVSPSARSRAGTQRPSTVSSGSTSATASGSARDSSADARAPARATRNGCSPVAEMVVSSPPPGSPGSTLMS
jgi:hypothetical protein